MKLIVTALIVYWILRAAKKAHIAESILAVVGFFGFLLLIIMLGGAL